MRVLITGAAGRIGRHLIAELPALGHEVVGLDVQSPPDGSDLPWHEVDCTDPESVTEVFASQALDAVVHLAGNSGETDLPTSLTSHAVATGVVVDAMVAHGVRRIVYASSNHAVGRTPRQRVLGVDTPPRPDTFYGVGKVAAEAVLRLAVDRLGIDAVACRIGSFLPRPLATRHLATWLSPGDCVRMVQAGLTTEAPGFAVLYGISANSAGWWDLAPGRALGYHPQDDAAHYSVTVAPADEFDDSMVGGPFAGPDFERPAIDPPR